MKYSILTMIVSCLVALPALAEEPSFKMPEEYSTDTVTKVGGQEITTKTFVSKDKTRTETEIMGNKSIAIMRMDKKLTWTLMPAGKQYMEMKLPEGQAPSGPTPDAKWEKVGDEAVEGEDAVKYKVTVNVGGKEAVSHYWVSKKTNAPLKIASSGAEVYYKNFKAGPQDAALFELPEGYSKMQVPGM